MTKFIRLGLWLLAGITLFGTLGTIFLMVASRRAAVPATIGVRDGQLAACPPSPNCVSSQATRPDQYLPPLPWNGPAPMAIEAISALIAAEPRAEIIVAQPDYVHAVFRSPTIGFPDDVEFYVDDVEGFIHFRSAARLGYGDGGVNRQRMERLSSALSMRLPDVSR